MSREEVEGEFPQTISHDTVDNSIPNEASFRFDETNYYSVCVIQRDQATFKEFVQLEIRTLLGILSVIGFLYNLSAIVTTILVSAVNTEAVFVVIHVLSAIAHCALYIPRLRFEGHIYVSLLPVLIITTDLLYDVHATTGYAYPFLWMLMLTFVTMTTLSAKYLLPIIFSCILMIILLFLQTFAPDRTTRKDQLLSQMAMNTLPFLATIAQGYTWYHSLENEFLMKYLEQTRLFEFEKVVSAELLVKNRLMTSVLPKYIADEISREYGLRRNEPFRKMYITRHDNVTIVFADIVGFTAISSFYSADQLVGILHQIFATLDGIADKYHQLRLKILGDCYYCICGLPDPHDDHAQLSVGMGFSIIDAIRNISTKFSMRVGIHTGSVLSGVMGLKQWQFDILGHDVTIASLMEKSGIQGKVHITHVTCAQLKDDYVIIPSKAGQKEEFLKKKNIKTFFVTQTHQHQEQCNQVMPLGIQSPHKEKALDEIENIRNGPPRDSDWSRLTLRFQRRETETLYSCRVQFMSLQPYSYVLTLLVCFASNPPPTVVCWKCILTMLLGSAILLFNVITMAQGMTGLTEKPLPVRITENLFICISGAVVLLLSVDTKAWIPVSVSKSDTPVNITNDNEPYITSPMTYTVSDYVLARFLLVIVGCSEVLSLRHFLRCSVTVSMVVIFTMLLAYRHPSYNTMTVSTDMPTVTLLALTMAIIHIARQTEIVRRKAFLQTNEMKEKQQKLIRLRRTNQDLLYDLILPDIVRELLLSTSGNGLLQDRTFAGLCKIKTIGATYMVAGGLRQRYTPGTEKDSRWETLRTLLKFALKMMDVLDTINKESFSQFQLRIGINHGPLIAGVIGTQKPHYDIFGNTVNMASRMESTGITGKIQVLKITANILRQFGYPFKLRGCIKGKGKLETYVLSRTDLSTCTTSSHDVD